MSRLTTKNAKRPVTQGMALLTIVLIASGSVIFYFGSQAVTSADAHLLHWGLTEGNLEVAVEGWLRSTPASTAGPASAVVVVDRVIFLTVTDALRDQVARYKAATRPGSGKVTAGRSLAGRK